MASPFIITEGEAPDPVNTYNFASWRGSEPPMMHQQATTYTKPGADGVGVQKLGRNLRPFEAVLESHWANYANAMAGLNVYMNLPATDPVKITWNHIDWTDYNVRFYVLAVEPIDTNQRIYLLHADYDFPAGVAVISRWRFQPVEVIPPPV